MIPQCPKGYVCAPEQDFAIVLLVIVVACGWMIVDAWENRNGPVIKLKTRKRDWEEGDDD